MRSSYPLCLALILPLLPSCSDEASSSESSTGGTGGVTPGTGGLATGGTGGAATTGGQTATGGLGTTGGALPTGGQSTGGTLPIGGQSTGGVQPTGGQSTGGALPTGGVFTTGGVGGDTGGASTGGDATGGLATGGATTGGVGGDTGGASTGGDATGGLATGGATTGGANTGGEETGGVGETGGGGSVTCPSPALTAGDTNETVQVGGESRAFILHVPAAYNGSQPVPLVVDFHPIGGSASGERGSSPYPAQTDPEGVIMAFPNGKSGPMGNAWNVGPCCVANTDDVAFARALVERVQQVACIDPKRIYAVGFSMGGGMSHYIACHAADLFAAVAPAAFDLLEENVGSCNPPRPISVIAFRGTSDSVVPYAGGYSSVVSGMPITFLGAQGTFEKWAEINGCTGSASAEDAQGCKSYSTCEAGVEVTLCTKQGGGHEAGNASVGWPALKRHTLP